MRDKDRKLRSILAFDRGDKRLALEAYERAEGRGVECVLLGGDSLSECIATHGNWFDEPSALDPLELGF
jgi:hypothetical protein